MSSNKGIRTKLTEAWELASKATVSGLGLTTVLIARHSDDWDAPELAIAGFGLSFLGWFGGYALFRNTPETRRMLLAQGWSFNEWWPWGNNGAEIPDWFEQMDQKYNPSKRKFSLPIGIDPETGKIVEIQMKNGEVHQSYTGITGAGKSFLVKQQIAAAAMLGKYQVCIVSLSGKDYSMASHLKNVHLFSFNSRRFGLDMDARIKAFVDHLYQSLIDFNAEILRRQELAEQHGVADLSAVRADMRPPALMLILEEFTNALHQTQHGRSSSESKAIREGILSKLATAINFGRSSQCYVVLVSQRPSGQISPEVMAQVVRVVARTQNAREASLATGRGKSGAENLRMFDSNSGELSQVYLVSPLKMQALDVPFTPPDQLEALARQYENETKYLGDPAWLSFFEAPNKSQITLDVRAELPAGIPIRAADQKRSNTSVTGVTVTAGSGAIFPPTSGKSEISEVVTPPKPSKPVLTLANWNKVMAAAHSQIKWPADSPSPTESQWILLSLFSLAGADDYLKLPGPAVFNGSHGEHLHSWKFVQTYKNRVTTKLDDSDIQIELRKIIKLYHQGYLLFKDTLTDNTALTHQRFVALGLAVWSGFSKNQTFRAIFGGKNQRYAAYYAQAEQLMGLYESIR